MVPFDLSKDQLQIFFSIDLIDQAVPFLHVPPPFLLYFSGILRLSYLFFIRFL